MKPTLTLVTSLLLAPLAALHAAEPLSTFCNPLPTPNYPVGFLARSVTNGEPDARQGWILGKPLPEPIPLKIQFPISPAPARGAGRDRKKLNQRYAPTINKCCFLGAGLDRLGGAGNDGGVVAEKQTAEGRDTADENDVETG